MVPELLGSHVRLEDEWSRNHEALSWPAVGMSVDAVTDPRNENRRDAVGDSIRAFRRASHTAVRCAGRVPDPSRQEDGVVKALLKK
jgi:hypothetical protein